MLWVCPSVIGVHHWSQLGFRLTWVEVSITEAVSIVYPQLFVNFSPLHRWTLQTSQWSSSFKPPPRVFSTFTQFFPSYAFYASQLLSSSFPVISTACAIFVACRFSVSPVQPLSFWKLLEVISLAVFALPSGLSLNLPFLPVAHANDSWFSAQLSLLLQLPPFSFLLQLKMPPHVHSQERVHIPNDHASLLTCSATLMHYVSYSRVHNSDIFHFFTKLQDAYWFSGHFRTAVKFSEISIQLSVP